MLSGKAGRFYHIIQLLRDSNFELQITGTVRDRNGQEDIIMGVASPVYNERTG